MRSASASTSDRSALMSRMPAPRRAAREQLLVDKAGRRDVDAAGRLRHDERGRSRSSSRASTSRWALPPDSERAGSSTTLALTPNRRPGVRPMRWRRRAVEPDAAGARAAGGGRP